MNTNGKLEALVDDLGNRLDDLEVRIENLDSTVEEIALGDLDSRVNDIESRLTEAESLAEGLEAVNLDALHNKVCESEQFINDLLIKVSQLEYRLARTEQSRVARFFRKEVK